MSTAPATPAEEASALPDTGHGDESYGAEELRSRLGARVRAGQIALTVLFALCGVIALSTLFADDPFEQDAVVLIASFGSLGAVLGLAAVWGGIRSRIVRVALWALPLFFVWHIAALGTWIPDVPLGVISGVGAALVTGASDASTRSRR